MRPWLLTNTTYGTWLPGEADGSIASVRDRRPEEAESPVRREHDTPGEPWEDDMPGLRFASASRLKCSPIHLDVAKAEVMLAQFQETAKYRNWQLLAVAIMHNHYHLVVAVPDDPEPAKIRADFKAYATRALNRKFGEPASGTWWTGKGSMRKLKDEAALRAAIEYMCFTSSRTRFWCGRRRRAASYEWRAGALATGGSALGCVIGGEPAALATDGSAARVASPPMEAPLANGASTGR